MEFMYGPEDHYGGGYLQLFTKDGEFLEEVATYSKNVGYPQGAHVWLSSNWLVYSDRKDIVFTKFEE